MRVRAGRLLLWIVLVPLVLYAGVKGLMYYNAKQVVDDAVLAASPYAEVSYAGITTDIRGAVTVDGISVVTEGDDPANAITIDHLRLASDDLLFFLRGGHWQPGENAPPMDLAFDVAGARFPLTVGLWPAAPGNGDCADGLKIEPALLKAIGFEAMAMDLDGYYRADEVRKTLDLGVNMELRDIESMRLDASLTDVDIESMKLGSPPSMNLGRLDVAMAVSPEFGRRALQHCAAGGTDDLGTWSDRLANQALAELRSGGLELGAGLTRALERFYRDWGEVRLVAAPAQPVGMLSLMFLPPDQLVQTLGLGLSLNGQAITDTGFKWTGPQAGGLASFLGSDEAPESATTKEQPKRIIVRRDFERVPAANLGRYLLHEVKIKPRGQPLRHGRLLGLADGTAEVQQTLHGGKYTVYVPVRDIESLEVLVERRVHPTD